ncbi:MAG: sulfatase [Opitutaceae bacterium]|nr:sulfatase [Cephaloticoccus sp.]MCP5530196.1 sulfatase [Opitutaceae bacterium]
MITPQHTLHAIGILAGGILGAASLSGATTSPTPRPPNIVFILADDMGWNQVGYQGFTWYETPNIDRIAREGLQFHDAYSSAPICSPTRAALMTGKAPARLHLTDYIPGNPHREQPLVTPRQLPCLPLEATTIPEMLRSRDYVSGHFGKWHLGLDYHYQPGRIFDPASQGFDDVFTAAKPVDDLEPPPPDAHSAEAITDRAIRFIEANRDRPFFCYVPHNVVHRPLYEEESLIEKYRRKPGADQPEHNPIMGAMIERMDRGIGRILETLKRLGLEENTIVIFTSDNGNYAALQSQAPLRAGKSTLYEGGIRVPMAVRWPGVIAPGRVSNEPVIMHDWFSTIMEIAGVPYRPDYADGTSLLPLLRGESEQLPRAALYWHYPHYHHFGGRPSSAIRKGDYKLIAWHEGELLDRGPRFELYNVISDPSETKDRSLTQPELAASLYQELLAWRREVGAQEMSVSSSTALPETP